MIAMVMGAVLVALSIYIAFSVETEGGVLFALIVMTWGIQFMVGGRLEILIDKLKKQGVLKHDD